MSGFRTEEDSLGRRSIPAESLIGINTVRGVENFPLGSRPLGSYPRYVRRLIEVKQAAARANTSLAALPSDVGAAIDRACSRLSAHVIGSSPDPDLGRLEDLFPTEILEGSGGTSTNMNLNEVIANLALDELGERRGRYDRVHPNDHVNLGQSTNDVVPTGLKLAVHDGAVALVAEYEALAQALDHRGRRWADVLRIGRTCLQAAQPMTLGQAFGGYGAGVARAGRELQRRADDLLSVPLGATAIGTGLGAVDGYRGAVLTELAAISGLEVRSTPDLFDGEQNADALARMSAETRTAADLLAKVAADIILLSSALDGSVELTIPPVQAGSSLMPGKVNPVIPMAVQQAAFTVFGNDASVALAAGHGQLELNHFEPVIARCLFDSITVLTGAAERFRSACIEGTEPAVERSRSHLLDSPAIATALANRLGYQATADLVKRSGREHRSLIELAVDEGLIDADAIDGFLLDAARGPRP